MPVFAEAWSHIGLAEGFGESCLSRNLLCLGINLTHKKPHPGDPERDISDSKDRKLFLFVIIVSGIFNGLISFCFELVDDLFLFTV